MQFVKKNVLNITITGGAGRIAFELLPLLCNGVVFGPDQKIAINLYDVPQAIHRMKGVAMETEDGAYPLLEGIRLSTNSKEAFTDCDVGICIASYPHLPGMERRHLLEKNAEIFRDIGENINNVAAKDCRVVVVANPVNSLTTILAHAANKLPKENFTGLSRLDYNRAKYMIAKRCNTTVDKVTDLIVWGNHSDTQYPDTFHCKIDGKPIKEVLLGQGEEDFLHNEYVHTIVNRWKAIVDHMGTTSVMGPANAVKDHLRDWYLGTEPGDYISMGVITNGEHYGLPKGICYSLPCETKNWAIKIIDDLQVDEFTKTKMQKSCEEIVNELRDIGHMI